MKSCNTGHLLVTREMVQDWCGAEVTRWDKNMTEAVFIGGWVVTAENMLNYKRIQ